MDLCILFTYVTSNCGVIMKKYVIDLQLFSQKLCAIMIKKGMVYGDNKPDPIALYNALYPSDKIEIKNIIGFNRSDYMQKVRKQYNWINGKGYPKNITDVLELCNALECDLDYLFTDMPCATHDTQFVQDKTGLSEGAIERLIMWSEEAKLPHRDYLSNAILFISDLIECCNTQASALAQNVSNYLFYRKVSETGNLTSEITKGIYDKREVERVRASFKFMDCLEYIYKHSKNVPTKESLQAAYPKTDEEKYLDDVLG